MRKLTTHRLAKHIIKPVITILLMINPLINNVATADEMTSVSRGELSQNLTTNSRLTLANEIKNATVIDQDTDKATNKTRTEILEEKKNTKLANKTLKPTSLARSRSFVDYSIYGALSVLQDDYDNDGFYQTFSVIFDADIISYNANQFSEVYALLYISKNGRPWTHYYTTNNFVIQGDTDLDEYEVITTFLSGYSTDYYDILIDLYQEGYNDIVATYSSDDSNALYALPLESADYDEPYIEVIEINRGGSFSIITLLLFLLIYLFRLKSRKS